MSEELKSYLTKKKNLSFKAIDLMREQILKIDPNDIILDALNSACNQSPDKNVVKNELLEQVQKNAINSFISDIKNNEKNLELIKKAYNKELKDFANSTKLLMEREKKETKEYISKYEILNKQNKTLEQRYSDIKSQFKEITNQQKNSINQIAQMKKRDSVLIVNKPIFNDFLKQFKNQAPKKIIEDIEKEKDGHKTITKEYNNIINKIIFEKKIFEMQNKRNNDYMSETNNKIHNLEEENVLIQKDFENTVNNLLKEIRNLQGLKEDNDKYRKMLYQLYNRLIDAYCLDKNIRINKKYFDLNRSDYKPNLLDDNEICKYIKLMISSMNPSTSDQLLRETIAYSNMITRVYLKNKINLKYDPLSTFKELKDIMEKNEEKILQLSNNVKEYENKINLMAVENKKLNNMINYFHQERNKMIENKQNINVSNNLKPPGSSKNLGGDQKHYKKILTHARRSTDSSSLASTYNYYYEKNKRRKHSDYIYSVKKFKQRRQNIIKDMELSKNKSISTKIKKIINIKNANTTGLQYDSENRYRFYSIDSKKLKNPLYQSLQSMNTNKLINKHYKVSEGTQAKKSTEKGTKQYGSQSMATFINEFQQLIEHTNRLFLYQAKIAPKFFRDKNLRNAQNNRKKRDINSFIKSSRKNKSTGNLLQDFVKTKIIGRINGMINNLEYNEKDQENDNEIQIK